MRERPSRIRAPNQGKSLHCGMGVPARPLEFGYFAMTAERSNRIAQAAVATLWRPGLIC
jgi:hypothetical protein